MGLLKKKKGKKKPLRSTGRGVGAISAERPQQVLRAAPCMTGCDSCNDVRGWITTIAQHEKTGITLDEAITKGWETIVVSNPFPSVMGRVCPHHCEAACNRVDKDGAVQINAMERFLGDWAIDHDLKLPLLDDEAAKDQSIGVIGGGPAGLSFAYQMRRRGYSVTVYEANDTAGGMLFYGIPFYRLPADKLAKEIQRVVDTGVELKLNTKVGEDVSLAELREQHQVLFFAIGAHAGRLMRIEGEEGAGVWTGTDYLGRVNRGEQVDVGKSVIVIGGGDTAVDAARAARRAGAAVKIVYRRTRKEMPAIDTEVEDAFKEDIEIEFLAAPAMVKRDEAGNVSAMVVQRMRLGEPDKSGRRRPVPIEHDTYEMPVDTVIAAISQGPDWKPVEELKPAKGWLQPDEFGKVDDNFYAGGDAVDLGIANEAVYQGRRAAERIHVELQGLSLDEADEIKAVAKERIRLDLYDPAEPQQRAHRPVEEWLTKPDDEIDLGITQEQLLEEVKRCMSCGQCFGCERCWMFCTPGSIKKLPETSPGSYYKIELDTCDGCKKCADECPCGFIEMV